MMKYKTIRQEADAEKIIEKSRFIGHVRPVDSKEEADAFIAGIRAAYRDATHNVPAYIIGQKSELQWASDDGEPSGTSGAPMLQMMLKEGLTNIAVVITRYFGGIKLGPGGLVRAYTSTAKLAIESAGVCEVMEMDVLTVRLDYTFYSKLQSMAELLGIRATDPLYDEAVTISLESIPEETENLKNMLSEMTNGTCSFIKTGKVLTKK